MSSQSRDEENEDTGDYESFVRGLLDGTRPVDMMAATFLTKYGRAAIASGDLRSGLRALELKHEFVITQFGSASVYAATSAVDMAEARSAVGDFQAACALAMTAIADYRRLGIDGPRLERALDACAMATYLVGDYASAELQYLEIIARASGDAPEVQLRRACAMDHLAQVYKRSTRYVDAERLLHGALEIFLALGSSRDAAVCVGMLASVYFQTNRYRESEVLQRRALGIEIGEYGRKSAKVAKTLDHLGSVLSMRAQEENVPQLCDEAIALHEEALAIFSETLPASHVSTLRCAQNLASSKYLKSSLGKMNVGAGGHTTRDEVAEYERALGVQHPQVQYARLQYAFAQCQDHAYDDAVAIATEATDRLGELMGRTSSACLGGQATVLGILRRYASYLLGEPTGALSPWQNVAMQLRANELRGQVDDERTPMVALGADIAPGLISVIDSGLAAGVAYLADAWAFIDANVAGKQELSRDETPDWRQGLADHLELLVMARRLGRLAPAQASERAFEAIQIVARLSAVASAFDAGLHAGASSTRDAKLRRRRLSLAKDLGAAEDRLVAAARADAMVPGHLESLRREMDALEVELAGISEVPLRISEVAEVLAEDEALATYILGTRALFILTITKRATSLARVHYEPKLIEAMVEGFVNSIKSDEAAQVGELPAVNFMLASDLYKALVKPLEPMLDTVSTVFLVPDGALWGLPFAALLRDEAAFLSAARLWDAEQQGHDVPAGFTRALDGAALVFQATAALSSGGDVLAPCVAATRSNAWLSDRFATAFVPSASTLVALRRAEPLPDSASPYLGIGGPETGHGALIAEDAEELLYDIASALEADPATSVLLGASATKQRLMELDRGGRLASARTLCFATHAQLGEGELLGEPGLLLGSDETSDAVLWASEASRLQVDAEWVVLIACKTASASGRAAHVPLSGMARAFLLAGARGLLLSHWLVDSTATRALISELFHSGLASTSKPVALQEAMHTMRLGRKNRHFAHPGLWASFFVVGGVGTMPRSTI